MTAQNLKDFLACGAFLQIGPDLFKLLVGPFTRHTLLDIKSSKEASWLYMPKFWDFMGSATINAQSAPIEDVYQAHAAYILSREEFIGFLSLSKGVCPEIQWKNVNAGQFQAQFDWSQQMFSENKLQKTVPIIRQQGDVNFSEENLLWCMQKLIADRIFGWSYGFFSEGQGFVGHTPEVLVQWNEADLQLKTVALAGTYPKTPRAFDEIVNDQKVIQEHQIVIDDIERQLQGLNFHPQVLQGETDVLELKYLLHLMTDFELEVSKRDQVFDVIRSLHPTAAMGLYPRSEEAFTTFKKFSLQQERGYFASPFALIEEDQISCVVSIRNLMFTKTGVEIFSGCGVTSESHYQSELDELQGKRDSVKKMLGLLN
ncbi:chorismate-binding protein [Pseudobdellovibrio exovorus]|uniref:Menaquinone-specific isochorismate synthase n=1 Tax=Pseudobdellovibrio exovorus JSS TaxID=1184267 RepID=M4V680_9BACT|nr:chorismate-binding protein [Pseudobdellovibrio exovorus]AGH94703.1 menaquinone-specific isochorismate synthase [Pseudobdellovibrio exovorus JSS]